MTMISCYNRGCGKDFDPENNADDACRHHPGTPFFHDAYKGWTCCNKKSVDFTEFLNIKGCQVSNHSNVKPIEPAKPAPAIIDEPVVEIKVREPVKPSALVRPSLDAALTVLEPDVASTLKQSIDNLAPTKAKVTTTESNEIVVGTICKKGGCGVAYESAATNDTVCVHHPGVPIFHEGLKFWSCCTKRTTDFAAFMSQKGCANGEHKWIQDSDESKTAQCRYDWHQTGANVIVTIYAKMYHYAKSFVKLNPVRLAVKLIFPQQDDAEFNLDLELRGIVDVRKSTVEMFGTKVEITMPKAEPGQWATLDLKQKPPKVASNSKDIKIDDTENVDNDSDVDLDDIEPLRGCKITDA